MAKKIHQGRQSQKQAQAAVSLLRSKTKIATTTFGKHLTLDAYGCDSHVLDNMEIIFKFLDELPAKIAMHKIITPYVIKCGGNNLKDCGGISGFVMIAESHISIHTFPAKKYLTMDLYSCNLFDHNKVIKIVKDVFSYQQLEKHIIKRGLLFPKDNLA